MTMEEICRMIDAELAKSEPTLKKIEEEINYHLTEADKLDHEATQLRINVASLTKAKAALLGISNEQTDTNISNVVEEPVEAKATEEPDQEYRINVYPDKKEKTTKKTTGGKWAHQEVWQYDANGNIMNSFTSQHSAARHIGWSQSGLSHFMKQNKDTQIRKKGFYFVWVG